VTERASGHDLDSSLWYYLFKNMEEITSNAIDSKDDHDWEEILVPEHQHHLEITLQTHIPIKTRTSLLSF
jgi:hypothetical protein